MFNKYLTQLKYAKHIIAASIATLIVGCSSESEPAPENQRPTITLPEGSTYDVSEGGGVTVEFDVQDEGAVSEKRVLIRILKRGFGKTSTDLAASAAAST